MTKHDIRATALAIIEAEKSMVRQQHGAVIYRHGYLISKGFNKKKTHPRASNYPYPYIHAELAAILRAKDDELEDASLVVVRINKRGKLVNSFPCSDCMQLIKEAGIKYIVYSTNKDLIKIKL